MFATDETVGLPEWIIDDTCLVQHIFAINLQICFLCGHNFSKFLLFCGFCMTLFEKLQAGSVLLKHNMQLLATSKFHRNKTRLLRIVENLMTHFNYLFYNLF